MSLSISAFRASFVKSWVALSFAMNLRLTCKDLARCQASISAPSLSLNRALVVARHCTKSYDFHGDGDGDGDGGAGDDDDGDG